MFNGFSRDAFDVFEVPGLDARMEAIKSIIRPELEQLGATFAPLLIKRTRGRNVLSCRQARSQNSQCP